MNRVTKQRINLNPCEFGDENIPKSRIALNRPRRNSKSDMTKILKKKKKKSRSVSHGNCSLLFTNPEMIKVTKTPRPSGSAGKNTSATLEPIQQTKSPHKASKDRLMRISPRTNRLPDGETAGCDVALKSPRSLLKSPRVLPHIQSPRDQIFNKPPDASTCSQKSRSSNGDDEDYTSLSHLHESTVENLLNRTPRTPNVRDLNIENQGRTSSDQKRKGILDETTSKRLLRKLSSFDRTLCSDESDEEVDAGQNGSLTNSPSTQRLSASRTLSSELSTVDDDSRTLNEANSKNLFKKLSSFDRSKCSTDFDDEDNVSQNIPFTSPLTRQSVSRRLSGELSRADDGSRTPDEANSKNLFKKLSSFDRSECSTDFDDEDNVSQNIPFTSPLTRQSVSRRLSGELSTADDGSRTPDEATSKRLLKKLSSFDRSKCSNEYDDDNVERNSPFTKSPPTRRLSVSRRLSGELSTADGGGSETPDEATAKRLLRKLSSFDRSGIANEHDDDEIEQNSPFSKSPPTRRLSVSRRRSGELLMPNDGSKTPDEVTSKRLLRKLSSFNQTGSDESVEQMNPYPKSPSPSRRSGEFVLKMRDDGKSRIGTEWDCSNNETAEVGQNCPRSKSPKPFRPTSSRRLSGHALDESNYTNKLFNNSPRSKDEGLVINLSSVDRMGDSNGEKECERLQKIALTSSPVSSQRSISGSFSDEPPGDDVISGESLNEIVSKRLIRKMSRHNVGLRGNEEAASGQQSNSRTRCSDDLNDDEDAAKSSNIEVVASGQGPRSSIQRRRSLESIRKSFMKSKRSSWFSNADDEGFDSVVRVKPEDNLMSHESIESPGKRQSFQHRRNTYITRNTNDTDDELPQPAVMKSCKIRHFVTKRQSYQNLYECSDVENVMEQLEKEEEMEILEREKAMMI